MEAVELLGEVLDHVGALELAVHEDVEAHPLLPADRVGDEVGDLRVVGRGIKLALATPHP